MKIRFDHSYSTDQNFKFRMKLGKAGFYLPDYEVEHPGKRFCRFIPFLQKSIAGYQYLEFIHTGKGGNFKNLPGMSVGALSSLKKFNTLLTKQGLKTEFVHKNYNWKENSKDTLPGWNFVTFKRKMNVYTWMTEYEPLKNGKSRKRIQVRHPNGAHKIMAFDFTLSTEDIKFYSLIFGRPKNETFTMECGNRIHYNIGKKSRINHIILATKDLNKFVKKFPWDKLTSWQNQPGAVIENPNKKMWDIVLIQG